MGPLYLNLTSFMILSELWKPFHSLKRWRQYELKPVSSESLAGKTAYMFKVPIINIFKLTIDQMTAMHKVSSAFAANKLW